MKMPSLKKKKQLTKMTPLVKSRETVGYYFKKLYMFLLALQFCIGQCNGIKCYKCAVTVEKVYSYNKNATIVTPMCSKFTESDEYIVDCPYSTMCLKTISKLYLQNGQQQNTFTRGCAPQKDTKQVFNNGRWNQEHSVQEVYQEGCSELSENTMAASLKTHCYCRGNLCNTTHRVSGTTAILTLIVVVCTVLSCLIL